MEYVLGSNDQKFCMDGFARLGFFLRHVLFMNCSYSAVDRNMPLIVIPDDCLVSKGSCSVLYYVADLTLVCMSRALTIPKKNQQMYFGFVVRRCMYKDADNEVNLPISVMARRT